METDGFEVWTVYLRPLDYPHSYVLRRCRVVEGQIINDPLPSAITLATDPYALDFIRAAIPPGKMNIGRLPEDDPVILECWI